MFFLSQTTASCCACTLAGTERNFKRAQMFLQNQWTLKNERMGSSRRTHHRSLRRLSGGVLWHSGHRGQQISEFRASLLYTVSSEPTSATRLFQNNNNKKKPKQMLSYYRNVQAQSPTLKKPMADSAVHELYGPEEMTQPSCSSVPSSIK